MPETPREKLKKERRDAFVELCRTFDNRCYGIFMNDFDSLLDKFFESGIELARRKKENGE